MALLFDVQDHIAVLKFNRPEAMNAMDGETYRELSRAWIEVRDNPDIWVAIVTGVGDRAFTAGADLKRGTTPGASEDREPQTWRFWNTQEEMILNRGMEVWKPVIAAVNGYCLGGGNDDAFRLRPARRGRSRHVRPVGGQERHSSRQRRHPERPAPVALSVRDGAAAAGRPDHGGGRPQTWARSTRSCRRRT